MCTKKRILFIDDEPRVLQGLQRMLHGMRREWEMMFVENGRKALDIMDQQNFDVVVSDMRMPGMDGAELLKEVMNRYPQIIRIILSGNSDREMILKSVRTAHQYLSKPCDAATLKSTVVRACALRERLSSDEVKKLVSKMESLPSLPTRYAEIMTELQSPDPSIKRMGKIIEKDIGMSAKILQLINSAFFGLPHHISTPAQAASLLGLEIVKALVLSVQVFSQFDQSKLKNLSLNLLGQHSETVGHLSKKIYEMESNDKNIMCYALIAGLLHDIGKLILMTNFPKKYDSVISTAIEQHIVLPEIEMENFGVTHAEVGAYLLGLWGLPDFVVEAIAYHHNPSQCPCETFSPLSAVYVANIVEHEISPRGRMGIVQPMDFNYIREAGLAERIPVWKKICQNTIQEGD